MRYQKSILRMRLAIFRIVRITHACIQDRYGCPRVYDVNIIRPCLHSIIAAPLLDLTDVCYFKLPYPTQSYTEIWQYGLQLFRDKHRWTNDIRSLTIRAIDLIPASEAVQLDLWFDFSQHERKLVIEKTMEDLRRRFGIGIINYAALTKDMKLPGTIFEEHNMPAPMYQ